MTTHRPLCPEGRAAQTEPGSVPCPQASRPYVLAATILASAMGFIDGTVVTIALPAIQQDFNTSFATLQWVVNIYALILGSLILIGGSAGDLFGRRLVFLIGIGIFTAASIGCALAPSALVLIGARALQGAGAALMIPQSLAIIAASFPKDARGRAIGIWAGASAITTALGPPLGGFLIDAFDWRTVFWINPPIALAVVWLTWTHIPESRNEARGGSLDWLGGLLALTGFGALTLALTTASEAVDISAFVMLWFAIGVIGVAAFLYTERRAADPIMPLSLFRNASFSGANLTTLLLYGSFSAVLFLLPFDLIERRGYAASEVGLILLPIGLVIGVGSRFAGKWSDTAGPRPPLIIGSLIVAVAAMLFALNISA
ncbi:MAG TPA: MFS transporter, partial [Hyphomicrobiales bacterium]|nr:MFS transporter [Hyphomicrobiales bacterium]